MSFRYVFPMVFCSLLSACTMTGSAGEPSHGGVSEALRAPANADLNRSWALVSATGSDGQSISPLFAPGIAFRLQLSAGRANAHGGCNQLGGDYTLTGNRLTIALPMSTNMACNDAKNRADAAFRNAMTQSFSAELLSENPAKLLLRGERGEMLFFDAVTPAR